MNIKHISHDPESYARNLTLKDLKSLLQTLDYQYHDKDEPSVEDEVYDILRDVYDSRAKKPYAKIGHISSHKARQTKLYAYMGSMSKIKPNTSALSRFLAFDGQYVVSDKEDGISLSLVYLGGQLTYAHQRGDGVTGTDSSGVIEGLDVPKTIRDTELTVIRVEFTIDRVKFDKYISSSKHKDGYDNARNGSGGMLNRNENSTKLKHFKCVAHEVIKGRMSGQPILHQFNYLKSLGFKVVPHKVYESLTEQVLIDLLSLRRKKSKRDIDGLIVAKNIKYTPVTSGNPKHAVSFKVNSIENSVLVKVLDVEWNESRYGKLVPRIVIKPTTIGGVKVTYFTGHNAFYINNGYKSSDEKKKTKDNGGKRPKAKPINKGAVVRAIRSGDVIPYIMEVVEPSKQPSSPKVPFIVRNNVDYFAEHASDDRSVKSLVHFFNTIDVEGMKRATVELMIEYGFDSIKSILDATADDFAELPRTGHTKAVKLERSIKQSMKKNATFANIAFGSMCFSDKIGIKRLEAVFEGIPDILKLKSKREALDQIQALGGFKELANDVVIGIPKFKRFLKETGIKPIKAKAIQKQSSKLEGKSILFTSVRNKPLQEWIVANGGKIASSEKSADILIVKDEFASNKKVDAALEANKPVIPVDDFISKYKVIL